VGDAGEDQGAVLVEPGKVCDIWLKAWVTLRISAGPAFGERGGAAPASDVACGGGQAP
jgi:hypothetical protein